MILSRVRSWATHELSLLEPREGWRRAPLWRRALLALLPLTVLALPLSIALTGTLTGLALLTLKGVGLYQASRVVRPRATRSLGKLRHAGIQLLLATALPSACVLLGSLAVMPAHASRAAASLLLSGLGALSWWLGSKLIRARR